MRPVVLTVPNSDASRGRTLELLAPKLGDLVHVHVAQAVHATNTMFFIMPRIWRICLREVEPFFFPLEETCVI